MGNQTDHGIKRPMKIKQNGNQTTNGKSKRNSFRNAKRFRNRFGKTIKRPIKIKQNGNQTTNEKSNPKRFPKRKTFPKWFGKKQSNDQWKIRREGGFETSPKKANDQ